MILFFPSFWSLRKPKNQKYVSFLTVLSSENSEKYKKNVFLFSLQAFLKIDTVQFRTLANFRNDSQFFMFCDELGIFSQISLRKGERCYFKGEFCFRSADSRSSLVPDLFLSWRPPCSDDSHNLGGEMPQGNRVLHQSQHLGGDCWGENIVTDDAFLSLFMLM